MSATVLVLDNDPALRELLRMALERSGMRVLPAATAEEAREVLDAGDADLLLLDLNLAGGDCGLQRVREWGAAGCLPPFWMVTGTPDDPRLESIAEAPGFQGVVPKPFSVLDLAGELARRAPPAIRGGRA